MTQQRHAPRPARRLHRRLLVVSHPTVLAVNQLPYAELCRHGWDPFIVAPGTWRHEYASELFSPEVLPELAGRVVGRRVLLPGRVQRHVYVTSIGRIIEDVRPHVAFVEAEPTSVPAFQWGLSLTRAGVPFGVQVAENLDRHFPVPARVMRRLTLDRASFVAARSPRAAQLLRERFPRVPLPVVPHHVPAWPEVPSAPREPFTVGYAGRLVPEKGVDLLIDAVSGLDGVTVRIVGNGPLRQALRERAAARAVSLEIDTTVKHEDMAAAYAGFDVLVLPSRTTATWAEQFGRVLVEALFCGVPVVGASSGEIPWVINSTGGGLVFPEGDVGALRDTLVGLRDSPELRTELARRGRARVRELFSVEAAARDLDRALRRAAAAPNRPGRRAIVTRGNEYVRKHQDLRRAAHSLTRPLRQRPLPVLVGHGRGLRLRVGDSTLTRLVSSVEPQTEAAFQSLVRPGSTVYDIGANIGWFSLLAARQAGPTGHVVAFEPSPPNVAQIIANARANGLDDCITVVPVAVAEHDGSALFSAPSSLEGRLDERGGDPVALVSLDSWIADTGHVPPEIVKIDVEAAEVRVLRGMEVTLRTARPVLIIELHGTNADVADALDAAGYDHRPLEVDAATRDAPGWVHVLATPAVLGGDSGV